MRPEFVDYQKAVVANARAMVKVVLERGYRVVSGGTDNHLFLMDFIKQGLTGKAVDEALGRVHITVNKNAVPNDPQTPFVTSGIRIGTPAITTRGFGLTEAQDLAHWVCDIVDHLGDQTVAQGVLAKVKAVCQKFPVYES